MYCIENVFHFIFRKNDNGIQSSVTISQVSKADLRSEYCCVAASLVEWNSVCIKLRTKGEFTLVLKGYDNPKL